MHKILLTCPPMIGIVDQLREQLYSAQFDVFVPEFTQEMSEENLCKIIGDYDGWIIGDDPATRRVLEAGKCGRLKACMRWGVGTDNVDFNAFQDLNIPIENTPGVFGNEVADLAMHYITGLLRDTFQVDRSVRSGGWEKPIGKSLWSSNVLIVGMGDIGTSLARRLVAHGAKTSFYDPYVAPCEELPEVKSVKWPQCVTHNDVVVFTAPLTTETYHIFNDDLLHLLKPGVKIVNVGRGQVINQKSLVRGFDAGIVSGAALDVYEREPFNLGTETDLGAFSDKIIFGSHNGSNTLEAVTHVSVICIDRLKGFLDAA